ncbi:MAG: AraC family transcriptional regulator [Opitutaceae bacterium]|nr:AraC family transcriptional regulator [Opitutaceae bacterium]
MPSQREDIQFAAGNTLRLLRWNRSVNRVEVVHGPGEATPLHGQGDHWHYHRATELTLIQRGAGTRFVADHIELFDSGDLVLIGANVPHYWHQRGVSTGLSIQWDFPLEHGIWGFGEAAPLRKLTESARRGLHIQGKTSDVARRRIEELPSLSGLARLALFFQILDGLAEAPPQDIRPLSLRPFSLDGTEEHQEAVRQAVSYILAHYRETVSLQDLLRLTSMSRATFARQFRHHAGKSFSTFLNQVRLQAVCRALRDTTNQIGNIALDHGFNQLSFFNRLFRREFGVSPSEFRNQQYSSILDAPSDH